MPTIEPLKNEFAMPQEPKDPNPWRQAGLAMSIPMMMISGVLVGVGLGWLIRRMTGWGWWVDLTCIALGAVAGVREMIAAVRRISNDK